MGLLSQDIFVCIDLETTGLSPNQDQIIELAAARFSYQGIEEQFETLIDPAIPIPTSSTEIHHITDEMVKGKPKIEQVLPDLFDFVGNAILIGHGIGLDIAFLCHAAKKADIPCQLSKLPYLDTLRIARLYGDSPNNALETLRKHFNIAAEGAHRAMNDVVVNIEVFKYLTARYKTTEQLSKILERPIALKVMPLGKYKGRSFSEIPLEYLLWASKADFDQDLIYSLRSEIKRRKKGTNFQQVSNPFSHL